MTSTITSSGNNTSENKGAEAGRIARFVVIGLGSVAIDFCVLQLLQDSMPRNGAKGISYVAGMIFGFIGNKFWSFKSERKSLSEPIIYILLYAFTFAVNIGVFAGVFAILDVESAFWPFFIATGVTTVLNYIGLRWLTFREGIRQHDEVNRRL